MSPIALRLIGIRRYLAQIQAQARWARTLQWLRDFPLRFEMVRRSSSNERTSSDERATPAA